MILPSKMMTKKLKGFTLIEVLVSITIISIATLSTLAVFVQLHQQMSSDSQEKKIYSLIESKLASYASADDLKSVLFSHEEIEFLNANPHGTVPLIQTNFERHTFLISRKIRRWNPLLVDVGMEAVFRHNGKSTNTMVRHYWIESTFSESVNHLY